MFFIKSSYPYKCFCSKTSYLNFEVLFQFCDPIYWFGLDIPCIMLGYIVFLIKSDMCASNFWYEKHSQHFSRCHQYGWGNWCGCYKKKTVISIWTYQRQTETGFCTEREAWEKKKNANIHGLATWSSPISWEQKQRRDFCQHYHL